MYLSKKTTGSGNLLFGIHNIPFNLLEKNGESYSVFFQDNQDKYFISFLGSTYIFIENIRLNKTSKTARNRAPIFRKRDDQTFDVDIRFSPSSFLNHKFVNGPLVLDGDYDSQVSFKLEIHNISKEFLAEIRKAYNKGLKKKIKKEKQKKREASTRELVKKFEELEKIEKQHFRKSKDPLAAKGVYLAHPNSFKRCENCANNTGLKCSIHNLEVSDNHRCSRFYAYKTFYGGGFSPK